MRYRYVDIERLKDKFISLDWSVNKWVNDVDISLALSREDLEPVIRCEDCQFSCTPEWGSDEVFCTKYDNWFKINGYCHLGRRKVKEGII